MRTVFVTGAARGLLGRDAVRRELVDRDVGHQQDGDAHVADG